MKYEIKKEDKRIFYGETIEIDMNKEDNIPFGEAWNRTSNSFDMKYFNSNYSSIGKENYPTDFMTTKKFTYSALMPVNSTLGLDQSKIQTLEAGKFICFQTTFGELTKGFIPQVFQYIAVHNIPVDYRFDYEEYPYEFDHNDPNSIVYVCWKYLGDK